MAAPNLEAMCQAVFEHYGPYVDTHTPLYVRRLMCHVGDKLPDVRKAKLLSPSVAPTPASQQASARAAASTPAAQAAGRSSVRAQASAANSEPAPSAPSDPSTSPPPPDPATTQADVSNTDSTAAATAQETEAQPEVSYAPWPQEVLLSALEAQMMRGFTALCRPHGAWIIPGFPRTASAAAELQAQIDQLVAQGEDLRAFPWLCQMAMYSAYALGADHSDTVDAVYRVVQSQYQRAQYDSNLHAWLVVQADRHWGPSHANTRKVVEQAADILARAADPRDCRVLGHNTAVLAGELPGGLGWALCSLAPLDEDAYSRHAVMQSKAQGILNAVCSKGVLAVPCGIEESAKRDCQLAKQMLERCITYYESVGPHWLASPRKISCMQSLATCIACLAKSSDPVSSEAGASLLFEAKRIAKWELGAKHMETLRCTYRLGEYLLRYNKTQEHGGKVLPLLQKLLRVQSEILGPRHYLTLQTKVGHTLMITHKQACMHSHSCLCPSMLKVLGSSFCLSFLWVCAWPSVCLAATCILPTSLCRRCHAELQPSLCMYFMPS